MTDPTPIIHLDTSFLIRALVPGTPEATALRGWLGAGHLVEMSTLAWGELLYGPLSSGTERLAGRVVRGHVPLTIGVARGAARLFSDSGRRRGSLADCVIAATAIEAEASLATSNLSDFAGFESLRVEAIG